MPALNSQHAQPLLPTNVVYSGDGHDASAGEDEHEDDSGRQKIGETLPEKR